MKIAFLYNHDALHQIAHTIPIAAELARRGEDVWILTSSDAQEATARSLLPEGAGVRFQRLGLSKAAERIDRVARRLLPFRRLAVLWENRALLASFATLVVPETTSALLKNWLGPRCPRLVYVPHGAGDRSVGFRPVTRAFDLVLLSGAKVRDRMLAEGLVLPWNSAIIGYPKFDTVDLEARPRFFDNGRPTVLYNPHFDPLLSSWYAMGEAVLDWFAQQDRFNLIFAPHVMLFKRRVHASIEHLRLRIRRELPARFAGLPHIRIDTGSPHSIDMSYTRAADIYLGDASSQIYEWITRPRPALFLNSHHARWQGNPDYGHWALGEVLGEVGALPAALDRALAEPDRFAALQRTACDDTFALSDVPAAVRGADSVITYIDKSR